MRANGTCESKEPLKFTFDLLEFLRSSKSHSVLHYIIDDANLMMSSNVKLILGTKKFVLSVIEMQWVSVGIKCGKKKVPMTVMEVPQVVICLVLFTECEL